MNIFMKIRPVETELIRADGRTDRRIDSQTGGQTWWS